MCAQGHRRARPLELLRVLAVGDGGGLGPEADGHQIITSTTSQKGYLSSLDHSWLPFVVRCGKAIDGYDHFNSGACVLFEADAIEAWNRMMNGVHVERNAAQDRIEALVEMHPNRVRNCPACRQPNIKVRDTCPRTYTLRSA